MPSRRPRSAQHLTAAADVTVISPGGGIAAALTRSVGTDVGISLPACAVQHRALACALDGSRDGRICREPAADQRVGRRESWVCGGSRPSRAMPRPSGHTRTTGSSSTFRSGRTVNALRQFVYESAHAGILKQRREWFEHLTDAYVALWWVPADHRPTVAEAIARLEHLKQHGPSPEAFTFLRDLYPAPDASDWADAGSPQQREDDR